MRVYAGRFEFSRAKSGTLKYRPLNSAPKQTKITGALGLSGVLEMDFEISLNKLKTCGTFRVFVILTKRACARLKSLYVLRIT